MGNNLYSFIAIVSFLVFVLLYRCVNTIKAKGTEIQALKALLPVLIAFSAVDGIWGLINAGTLPFGRTGLYIMSYLFHVLATVAAYVWFGFTTYFENRKFKKPLVFFEAIPVLFGWFLLICQVFTNCIFYISKNGRYITGDYRWILFAIQFTYFLCAFLKTVFFLITDKRLENRKKYFVTLEYTLTLLVFCILLYFFPEAPYYSVSFMFATIIVFNGSIVIDEEKRTLELSEYHKKESAEIYSALNALATGFVSLHLCNLELDKIVGVKTTPLLDSIISTESSGHAQMQKVYATVTEDAYKKEMLEFSDTYTLSARMKGKQILSHEFVGRNYGWCIASYIKVAEDQNGNITKAVHAVQSIDDVKSREKELQNALSRAYQNKNAIYAEMLKMLNIGMIATDVNETMLYANDMALKLFDFKGDTWEGINYNDFVRDAMYLDVEKAVADYHSLIQTGNPIEYCVRTESDEGEKILKANARKIKLGDGNEVVITSLLDITDSKQLEDKLRILSETDALTGIDNRRSGEAKIVMMLNEHVEGLFCLIDINKFKHINDTFGHHIGDEALRKISAVIKDSFRTSDIVMRIGGDEFAVFAQNILSQFQADTRIKNLFRKIEELEIPEMNGEKLSISLGATFIKEDSGLSFEDIYNKSDSLMYECKKLEGNNYKTNEA